MGSYSGIFYFLLTFLKKAGFIVDKLGLRVLIQREGELVNSVNKKVKCLICEQYSEKTNAQYNL